MSAKKISKKKFTSATQGKDARKAKRPAQPALPTMGVDIHATPAAVPNAVIPDLQPIADQQIDIQNWVASLGGSCADTACDAATKLGASNHPAAVEPLMAVLANTDGYYHSVVRAAAAAGLGQIGDRRAVPVLLQAISDPMAEASAEAVRALALLGDASTVTRLAEVVRNRDGFFLPVVRRAAVLALTHLGGAEAADVLREVAQNQSEDFSVRQAAIDGQ